jgi:hypothetical protein
MEALVGVWEVAQDVENADGMAHYTLGLLRDAYLADHPELGRKNLSAGLVDQIRRELRDRGYLLWPEKLDSHQQSRNVYVISKDSKAGMVLKILRLEPNPAFADVLSELLDQTPRRPAA